MVFIRIIFSVYLEAYLDGSAVGNFCGPSVDLEPGRHRVNCIAPLLEGTTAKFAWLDQEGQNELWSFEVYFDDELYVYHTYGDIITLSHRKYLKTKSLVVLSKLSFALNS